MVDTPRDEGDTGKSDDNTPTKNNADEPVKRRREKKKTKARKGKESNAGTGENPNPEDKENLAESQKPSDPAYDADLPGYMDKNQPKDPDDSEDSNYVPSIEVDESLGAEDFIVPEDPLDQEVFTQQLIATARSLKLKQI
ncbi:hypothetical protein ZWY2020_010629 [Hordeum vulgare]|nr:hypothetical protein ZWY2020_010629 [Hordeum vulgare]